MTIHTDIPTGQLPAIQNEIGDIVSYRDEALATFDEALEGLEAVFATSARALELAKRANGGRSAGNSMGGERAEALFRGFFEPEKAREKLREDLDASIWRNLLDRSGMRDLMDAAAKKEFETGLKTSVPEITEENIHATFETLTADAPAIFLRGLVNAFSDLDKRFKSHDGFKLGRVIILSHVFDTISGSFTNDARRNTIIDIERIFAKLEGVDPDPSGLMGAIEESRRGTWGPQQSIVESRYFRIRGWKNGNAHLWFTRPDLVTKVNKMLAYHYGEVLPDAAERGEAPEDYEVRSTAVARDLQFYATPQAACEKVFENCHPRAGARVLEPSAGEGAIVRALLAKQPDVEIDAIEIHPGRATLLRQIRGVNSVRETNFLDVAPEPIYDLVVMNPPFYRTHWMDHVRHAFEFLAPGGKLVAILPASAEVNETRQHKAFRAWVEKVTRRWNRRWIDLPAGSFASSGTNINTVLLTIEKSR